MPLLKPSIISLQALKRIKDRGKEQDKRMKAERTAFDETVEGRGIAPEIKQGIEEKSDDITRMVQGNGQVYDTPTVTLNAVVNQLGHQGSHNSRRAPW